MGYPVFLETGEGFGEMGWTGWAELGGLYEGGPGMDVVVMAGTGMLGGECLVLGT